MQRQKCEKCGKLLISPMGSFGSPYLLVGDFPGYQETIQGLPYAFRQKPTQTFSGDILRSELTRVGIMLPTVLVTNLWQHEKDFVVETIGKKKQKVPACPLEFHLDGLVALFKDRTHVLLMGSEVTQALLGKKVGSVSGLKVKVPGINKIHFWVSPNPALVYSQPIGELRLAFKRFAEDVQKKNK